MLSKTSRLTVSPLEISDFDDFDPIELQETDLPEMKALFTEHMPPHQAMARNLSGEPVLMFGFYEIGPKVYEMWTVFSKNWSPILYPSSAEWLNKYFDLLDFDRVQHVLLADRIWMQRVLEYLGFEQEAYLKKYVSGQDCFIYARFK